jgi:redox-sensitive bicupin YhaK (pirin superfamily)
VHLIRGQIAINGIQLSAGDALKISEESLIEFKNAVDAELLLFDLPY